ncbi:hypothetical protein BS47DRAFT_1400469 [Hydnum rufescens UP504]|uniref:Uncharacterized protein n=1 Tax=Hydnum rufescens UP504 TaxID=1448309 RepID=A0A9P6DIS7_9AGAM|nr:hypothetical protein BS47DRAFT_1400469 [Hydnum rufescens UP504]
MAMAARLRTRLVVPKPKHLRSDQVYSQLHYNEKIKGELEEYLSHEPKSKSSEVVGRAFIMKRLFNLEEDAIKQKVEDKRECLYQEAYKEWTRIQEEAGSIERQQVSSLPHASIPKSLHSSSLPHASSTESLHNLSPQEPQGSDEDSDEGSDEPLSLEEIRTHNIVQNQNLMASLGLDKDILGILSLPISSRLNTVPSIPSPLGTAPPVSVNTSLAPTPQNPPHNDLAQQMVLQTTVTPENRPHDALCNEPQHQHHYDSRMQDGNLSDEALNDKTLNNKAVNDKTTSDQAATGKAATGKAVTNAAATNKAMFDKAMNDKAINDEAGNGEAGNNKARDDKAGNNEAMNDKAMNDEAGNNKPVTNQAATAQAVTAQAGNDQAGSDQAGNDQAGNDQARNDQAGNDQAGNNQARNDQVGNDQVRNDQARNDQAGNSTLQPYAIQEGVQGLLLENLFSVTRSGDFPPPMQSLSSLSQKPSPPAPSTLMSANLMPEAVVEQQNWPAWLEAQYA